MKVSSTAHEEWKEEGVDRGKMRHANEKSHLLGDKSTKLFMEVGEALNLKNVGTFDLCFRIISWQSKSVYNKEKDGSRFAMSTSGELFIHQVTNGDSMDTYQCRTVNHLTQEVRASAPGRVIVSDPKSSVPPRINHHQASLTVMRGNTSEIPCAVQGLPIPSHSWFRFHGRAIQPVEADGRIVKINGLLVIQNTQVSDAGIYLCKVSNIIGEEKVETLLTVTESLSAYIEPQELTADVGQQIRFTCFASGHPITSVEWLKDGHPVSTDGRRLKIRNQFELTIASVERRDHGMYQCFVGNGDDMAQGSAQFKLGAISPNVSLSISSEPLQPGFSAKLQCTAVGSPVPQISWYLNGSPLSTLGDRRSRITESVDSNGNYISILSIISVDLQDGGYYKCVGQNSAGLDQVVDRLNIYGPVSIKSLPNVYAVSGKDLQLICPYLGYPVTSITWKKEGNLLPTDRRQRVLTNGILRIEEVAKSLDEGDYTCFVRNSNEQTSQQTRRVYVTVPPVIDSISFPARHGLQVGSRTRLQCVVTEGDLPITITWLKDGRPLTRGLGVSIRKDDDFSSVVTFSSITIDHHGNYTCIASNKVASVNRTTEIYVDVPPKWIVQPSDVHIVFQGSVTLDCAAEGSPLPTITWKQATGRFPGDYGELPLTHDRVLILANGSLHIRDVSKKDERYFLCEVTNGIGPPLMPAYFELKSQNKTSKRGDSVQMDCRAYGDSPMTITWTKDKVPLESLEDDRISRNDFTIHQGLMSELVITYLDKQDGGVYECTATNAYGKDVAQIHVLIREPPEAPDNIRIANHDSRNVHLHWNPPLEGSYPIKRYIVQYKLSSEEWKPLMNNVTTTGIEVTAIISNLLPGTGYSFRILAENDLGYGQASNGIAIATAEEEPSGAPRNVRAESIGSGTLLVTWQAPRIEEMNGELLGYNIGFKLLDSAGQYFFKTVEKEKDFLSNKVYLSPLEKYSNYSIKVQAYNRAGHGPASERILAATDEDVPSESPHHIHCEPLSSQRLNLSWSPPPVSSHNGIILGYKTFYKSDHSDDDTEDDLYEIKITVDTTVTLHDLEKWTNYTFIVVAFTRIGDGKKSSPIFCQTLQDVPGAPGNIKALVTTSTSILVSWTKPRHANGIITKFTLYMRSVDTKKQHTTKFPSMDPDQYSHEVRELSENLRYEFWITASTIVGEGESTRVVSQKPKSKAPARIASFPETILTSVNKNVSLSCLAVGYPIPEQHWSAGSEHVIAAHKRFHILPDGSLQLSNVVRSDSGNFSCRISNKFGSDEITHTIIVKAHPDVPTLVVTTATSSSIHVAWQLTDNGGNVIKGHLLHFKREYGEWEIVEIDKERTNFILSNLQCGKHYQVFLTSYNSIGASQPSNVVHTRTDGAAPGIPSQQTVIHPNTTAIGIWLAEWPDSGCPIRNFMIQYKAPSDTNWVMVSNNLQPHHEWAIIPELQPSTQYTVLVTVHNDAGTTDATYNVFTLPIPGMSSIIPINGEEDNNSFYLDISVVMPLVASFLACIIIIVSVCSFTRRCKYSTYRTTKSGAPTDLRPETENQTRTLDGRQPLECRSPLYPLAANAPNMDGNVVYDDVCPYATFSLMGYTSDDKKNALHLRTFAVQNEDDRRQSNLVPISDLYSKVTKRPKLEEHEGVILHPHHFPSAEDIYDLYPPTCEHQLRPYTRPVDENFSNSEWNVQDKRKQHESSRQFQHIQHEQVPDLLYHGTDSSSPTPNDSSPDDNPSCPSQAMRYVGWKQHKQAADPPPSSDQYDVWEKWSKMSGMRKLSQEMEELFMFLLQTKRVEKKLPRYFIQSDETRAFEPTALGYADLDVHHARIS
uniref:Down syndrome cell adhesion molecule-like protein Dscam2 n=1 Tax=Strigamia maritima TaxID=126957 RepID=T1JCP4_STRMM